MIRFPIFILILLLFSSPVFSADLVHSNPRKFTEINPIEVRSIFTRKITRWVDGSNITVYTFPLSSVEHRNFVFEWFGITTYRFQTLLNANTYTGHSSDVHTVRNDSEMILQVSKTPFSIGYLSDLSSFVVNDGDIITTIHFDPDSIAIQ